MEPRAAAEDGKLRLPPALTHPRTLSFMFQVLCRVPMAGTDLGMQKARRRGGSGSWPQAETICLPAAAASLAGGANLLQVCCWPPPLCCRSGPQCCCAPQESGAIKSSCPGAGQRPETHPGDRVGRHCTGTSAGTPGRFLSPMVVLRTYCWLCSEDTPVGSVRQSLHAFSRDCRLTHAGVLRKEAAVSLSREPRPLGPLKESFSSCLDSRDEGLLLISICHGGTVTGEPLGTPHTVAFCCTRRDGSSRNSTDLGGQKAPPQQHGPFTGRREAGPLSGALHADVCVAGISWASCFRIFPSTCSEAGQKPASGARGENGALWQESSQSSRDNA
ncbi:uncharacterized protein LOC129400157 [Sorex araneus]|uniref:uncharacterized protein LOC129400157 n=1 Tax=Sorex araneus TaxID=42254 RepID=UPI002433CAB4|nr:uncharacterized protein LOC129400157 [Sorex araneus]